MNVGISSVKESFSLALLTLMQRTNIASRGPRDKAIIEAYLISVALRIARIDKKSILESEDVKAAFSEFQRYSDRKCSGGCGC